VPIGLSGVTAIAAAESHSLALKSDGTVVAWGCAVNPFGECSVPAGLTDVRAIAAGPFHSLAVVGQATRPVHCTVPKVIGMRLRPARRTIAKKHCRTGKVSYATSRKLRGVVVKQSRRPGRVLPAGAKIDLVVSRGSRRG
jgi:hypothetical protein